MPRHHLSEIISTNVRSVAPDTPVLDALWLMRNEKISCVAVVLNDTPVGILTERDMLRATDKILGGRKLEVRDLMSQPVLAIEQHRTTGNALNIMKENKIRHLVIRDDNYNIVGMLTLTDILRKVSDECYGGIDTIDAIMAKEVRTVERGISARRVLREMSDHDLSCIIIEEDNTPLGIVTERDLVWLLTEKPDLWSTQIDDIMSIPVTTVPLTISPRKAVERMIHEGFRHLVVTDARGKIAGVLTQSLLCRELNFSSPDTVKKSA